MIAVDAMGGDFAPDAIVRGVLSSAQQCGIPICLFGAKNDLESRLDSIDSLWRRYPIEIRDVSEIIEMGEEPVKAVRRKKDSSLVRSIESVRDGECSVVLSAGNSGAVMAAALFLLGCNKGVDRPALVGMLPGRHSSFICLDLGANVKCKPKHLLQYAHLGSLYASKMLSIDVPSVGLLANGEEPTKGSCLVKEAFALLENSSLNFVGNVEPAHAFFGGVDVVVTDGFSGNIFLKTFEATSALCREWFLSQGEKCEKESLQESVKHGVQSAAMLLGVRKPVVLMHGNATASVVHEAISFAHNTVEKIGVERFEV